MTGLVKQKSPTNGALDVSVPKAAQLMVLKWVRRAAVLEYGFEFQECLARPSDFQISNKLVGETFYSSTS